MDLSELNRKLTTICNSKIFTILVEPTIGFNIQTNNHGLKEPNE